MTTEALLMPEKPAQPDHDKPYWTVAQIAEADRRSYERLRRED